MSEKIVQLNEEIIKGQIIRMRLARWFGQTIRESAASMSVTTSALWRTII